MTQLKKRKHETNDYSYKQTDGDGSQRSRRTPRMNQREYFVGNEKKKT